MDQLYHPVSSTNIKDKCRKNTIYVLMLFSLFLGKREDKQNVFPKKICLFFRVQTWLSYSSGLQILWHVLAVSWFFARVDLLSGDGKRGADLDSYGAGSLLFLLLFPKATQTPLFLAVQTPPLLFSHLLCRCHWCKLGTCWIYWLILFCFL